MSDDSNGGAEPTAEELEAAAALRRALDGIESDRSRSAAPAERPEGQAAVDEAVEAAALLRYSADGGELERGRAAAILAQVLPPAPSPRRRRWPWAVPAVGLAAAATAAFLLWPRALPVVALPRPPAALLHAQAAAARGRGSLDLRREMRGYRQHLLAALSSHYREAR